MNINIVETTNALQLIHKSLHISSINTLEIMHALQHIPEPFSIDGIIKAFEKELIKLKISNKISVFFDKNCELNPKLWYSSLAFDKINNYEDLSLYALKNKSINKENNSIAFPLMARNVYFGVIIINNESDINLETDMFYMVINYLSILLYSEKLSFSANKDKLTKLYNKGYILNTLENWDKNKKLYSIILLDLDKFKHYNDAYGHLTGDYILYKASDVMKKTLDGMNINFESIMGRYGGEEFVILLDTTNKKILEHIMELVRKSIAEYDFSTKDYSLRLTMSLGADIKTNEKQKLNDILGNADKALYKSKKSGRNKSTIN